MIYQTLTLETFSSFCFSKTIRLLESWGYSIKVTITMDITYIAQCFSTYVLKALWHSSQFIRPQLPRNKDNINNNKIARKHIAWLPVRCSEIIILTISFIVRFQVPKYIMPVPCQGFGPHEQESNVLATTSSNYKR